MKRRPWMQCFVLLEVLENGRKGHDEEIAGFAGISVFDGEKWDETSEGKVIFTNESSTHRTSEAINFQISHTLGHKRPLFVSHDPQLTMMTAVKLGLNVGPYHWLDLTTFLFALFDERFEKIHSRLNTEEDPGKLVRSEKVLLSKALKVRGIRLRLFQLAGAIAKGSS